MSISEAQRKRDPHAGPGDSYPLDPEHLKAAWDLAGHAANPDAVRAKVKAYARAHGLMDHLPETARDHGAGNLVQKAQGSQVAQLLDLAFSHEQMEGDEYEKRRLIEWAQKQGLAQHLPDEAHGFMHQHNMPHTHDSEAHPMHIHTVKKAFNPVLVDGVIQKAWSDPEGDPSGAEPLTYFEGWVARNTKDREREVVEPEAFLGAMDSYFARRAPLSYNHGEKSLPAGHLQQAAILRDGKVLKASSHPTDPADFEMLPTEGTGVYVRGVLTDPKVARSVKLGDTGGMSYIANLKEYEPLPGGGRRHLKYDPWIESCVAPYPVNPDAAITVAKAFGLAEEKEPLPMTQNENAGKLEQALDAILAQQNAPQTDNERVTKSDLSQLLEAFQVSQSELVETVKKAFESAQLPSREEGTGRVGGDAPDPRESDPVGYIVKKAQDVEGRGDEMDPHDKDLAYKLFAASMFKPSRSVASADDDE